MIKWASLVSAVCLATLPASALDIFFGEEPVEDLSHDDIGCPDGSCRKEQCRLYGANQAGNLRDAIINFRELNSRHTLQKAAYDSPDRNEGTPHEKSLNLRGARERDTLEARDLSERSMRCAEADQECRACSSAMVEFFLAKGFLASEDAAAKLRQQLGVTAGDHLSGHCSRYDFMKNLGSDKDKGDDTVDIRRERRRRSLRGRPLRRRRRQLPGNGMKLLIEARVLSRITWLSRRMSLLGNRIQPNRNISVYEADIEDLKERRGLESTQADVGRRYEFSCVRRRAEPQSGWFQLCDSCWVWRQLPRRFAPRLLNELICSPNSSRCLSGLGTCKQEFTTLTVEETLVTGGTKERQLQVGAGCTCSLYKHSPLQTLIEH